MIFLLGRQAMLGQEPPTYFRSITTVRIPVLARVHAMYFPASPLPNTTTSYSSIVCISLACYFESQATGPTSNHRGFVSSSNPIDVPADIKSCNLCLPRDVWHSNDTVFRS